MKAEIWQWIKAHPQFAMAVVGAIVVMTIGGGWAISQLRPTTPVTADPSVALTMSQSAGSESAAGRRSATSSTLSNRSSGPLYVDVKGAVKKPGLYQVQATMRVADVIALAQGLQPQADQQRVNLAAKVTDQQVIYVPVKGESSVAVSAMTPQTSSSSASQTGTSKARATSSTNTGPVNINSADVAAFQSVKGIGQKKAQKIIDYRQQHGPFSRVEDLKQVSGFGEKTIAKFKDQLTV